MKIEKYEASQERRILSAMILSDKVLARITAKWEKDGLFLTPWANTLATMCVRFYQRHQAAPGKSIESIVTNWASKTQDDTVVALIEKFLGTLDDNPNSVNPDFAIDSAANYFSMVRKKRLAGTLEACLLAGDDAKAEEAIRTYRKVEMGLGSGVDILLDDASLLSALDENKTEVLIKYPGDLGKFFGDSLARDNFVVFQAQEKAGKSMILMDLAWRAMLQHHRTAFFAVGDMTQDQIFRRFITRAAGRPLKPKKIRKPVFICPDDKGEYIVEFEEKTFDTKLDYPIAKAAFDRVQKEKLKSGDSFLKLYVSPAGHTSVAAIDQTLEDWAQSGFQTSVVVIDYIDLIRPSPGPDQSRDKINEIWMGIRALSQKWHCLVVTATQSNRASYTAGSMTMEHASEDKRKNAHATGIVGIIRSSKDRTSQVARYNWTVLREEEHNPNIVCAVAQCLAIANPCVKSCF